VLGQEDGCTGSAAIQPVRNNQTPASWVTESAPDPEPENRRADIEAPVRDERPVSASYPRVHPVAEQDPVWLAKYGKGRDSLCFWIIDEQASAYFNARHSVADLLPIEANGYGLAHRRGERIVSIMLNDINT
jgi:hypothetical protein